MGTAITASGYRLTLTCDKPRDTDDETEAETLSDPCTARITIGQAAEYTDLKEANVNAWPAIKAGWVCLHREPSNPLNPLGTLANNKPLWFCPEHASEATTQPGIVIRRRIGGDPGYTPLEEADDER